MPNEKAGRQRSAAVSPPLGAILPPIRPYNRLKAERVQKELRRMPGWRAVRRGAAISRVFRFQSSTTPMLFAALVDGFAREEGHHPTLTVGGREVICQLTLSEVGGVSQRDLKLAKRISLLK
jgi:4a-hydroxytetrahydrobiopterin dehydratase